jgi:hypothetical protein
MKRIFGVALLAAVAAAPVALEAQTAPAATGEQQAARASKTPLTRLLQRHAELGLTTEQVSRLQGIEQRLHAQNAPLIQRLRESGAWQGKARAGAGERMRNATPEQREAMRERMRNATPEQREAMRERMRNATPEQREAMRERRQSGEGARGSVRGERGVPEELRPVVEQLRANSRAALEEARGVLTAEQQARVRELAQQRRGAAGDRSWQRGARGTR